MFNRVMIIGHIGQDPEVKTTQTGQVATFSVATTEKWKGQDGQQQEQTEWHRVIAWKRLAEICGQYLKKGSLVYVEGKLTTRKWEKDGVTRYTTEIQAREMKILAGGRSSAVGVPSGGSFPEPPTGVGNIGDDVQF